MDSSAAQFADAFKLSIVADEIVLEFGRVTDPGAMPGNAAVAVSDRVVLPVDVGRRLVHWLDDALKAHTASLRAQEAKALPPAEAAAATRPGQGGARAAPAETGEKAALLLRLVGNLGIPYQYERSFRLSERALLANRFLLTVNARDIPGGSAGPVLEICNQLGMPQAARDAAEANFAAANCVHFGFEGAPDSIICKLYLERAIAPEAVRRARTSGEPVLLHLAFKWDLLRGAAVTTKYLWYPALSADEIAARLAHVYRGGEGASFAIAKATLDLGAGRAAAEKLQYLEVEEDENARRSFDLNLYNARLQVKDIQHLLHRMRDHFAVRAGQFQALYDQIATKALGHLAGGVHRDGKDFFNVYYGVVGFPHFNERFADAGSGGGAGR